MSDLPAGWEWSTVGSLAESLVDGPFGSNLKTEHYQPGGVRVVRLQNIADGRFDDTDKAYISEEHAINLSRHEVRPRDLLIAAMGDVLPRVCLTPPRIERAIVKADCFRLRPCEDVLPEFLAHMLSAPQTRQLAATQIAGVGRPRLNLKKVSALIIPYPPRAEQERIVLAIEEQFSRLDAGISAAKRAQQNLKRMRKAIMFAATLGQLVHQDSDEEPAASLIARARPAARFRGGKPLPYDLPGLPPGWSWALMGSLAQRVTVGHVGPMKDEYIENGIPFLRSQNVRENRFDSRGLRFISPSFHERLSKSRLLPGDLVIVRSGNVGTACVVPDSLVEANCADLVIVQRPEAIDSHYAALYMNSLARSRVRSGQVGVALTHFNTQSVAELPVPVPPLNEQKRIVAKAQALISAVDALESDLVQGLRAASALRSSILAAAFSGKLL